MPTPIKRLITIINNPDLKLSKSHEQDIVFYLKRLLETQIQNKRITQQNNDLQKIVFGRMKKIKIGSKDGNTTN